MTLIHSGFAVNKKREKRRRNMRLYYVFKVLTEQTFPADVFQPLSWETLIVFHVIAYLLSWKSILSDETIRIGKRRHLPTNSDLRERV